MATLLLLIIYIAYIGLGIPDSLFGTAWPAIYTDFQLPISFAGLVNVIISCGTVASSILSAKVIGRFGVPKVTVFSTALTAAALLGYSVSGNFLVLCLFAIPLGLGAGAIDAALNNYVSLNYSASKISFLHCFYGAGISVSPYILSLVINGEHGWRGGYRIAFIIQLAITLFLFFTLPVWKKVNCKRLGFEEPKIKVLTMKEIVKVPGIKTMWCLFFTSCTIEWTCGGWCSTFLVESKGMAANKAARIVMLYYIGMTIGRFLSGILAAGLKSRQVVKISQCVLGAAIVILLLPVPIYISAAGIFMAGLGIGPLFPNFSYLTPKLFGEDISQSVMGTQMAAANIGIMIAPPFCGILGQLLSMRIFPIYILIFYLIMMCAAKKMKNMLKSAKE